MSYTGAIESQGGQTEPDSQNVFPGRSLCLGCVSLVLSALLLTTLYVSLSPALKKYETAASREDIRHWTVRGSDLVSRMGQAESTDTKGLAITALQQGVDNRGIFTRRVRLNAADYPFLSYDISGRHAAEHVYFIWRTEEQPQTMHNAAVTWTGDGEGRIHLGLSEEWQGTITEVGLDIYGDLRNQPILVEYLTLLPSGALSLLDSIWTEWTDFQVWSQQSAHHLRGTPVLSTVSPTVAMAAWAGFAGILVLLVTQLFKSPLLPALTLSAAIPWITLDLLWQKNLNTQLEETKTLYAGKTQHEKHLAGRESELYIYAQHLKTHILPAPGARIFLVHDSPIRGFLRLRMQYFLLPHNVYNFDRNPRPEALQTGDYILVLDKPEGLSYSIEESTLQWAGQSLPVKRIDDSASGTLYLYEQGERK